MSRVGEGRGQGVPGGVLQDEGCEKWGAAWAETGRVFTRENGELLHPADVTRRFIELDEEIGLPPVRLHDLRHGAATLVRRCPV
ncbi:MULTISPECIES: hypothetical protein [Streptomyces]|uniref:hypothetical protein n=1 Tax=Streptomyces TaxID=1883 RepID=UPI00368C275B